LEQSAAHDLSEQQPLDASLEQQDLVPQAFLQAEAQLPVAAHELKAKAEIATADIKDRFWITFFINFCFCLLGRWHDCITINHQDSIYARDHFFPLKS